ncbi:PDZ domain-containing protein [Paraburkholderia sp. A3BS-1L]|uniref:PDZ domain-containing protein n=1 Tax=Paraburkholderia sp. A3BS-1L TaxID=3028375 RepID=UPI003DA99193
MTESAGDAGSPVLDPGGDVIGIETPVISTLGGVDGLAFAIPIDEAMKIEQQLQRHHEVQHGRLGITVQDVSGPLAQAFGLTKAQGALVSFVNPGGPAAKAGLRSGDVILQIDGAATDSARLPVTVADLKPGTSVQLVSWRDNAAHNASIILGKRGSGAQESTASAHAIATDGLTVRGLMAEEQHDAGVKSGVRVEKSVGPAAFAGIEPGDIILMVNNTPISSPMQFRDKVESSGHSLALLVERNGEQMFVTIDVV